MILFVLSKYLSLIHAFKCIGIVQKHYNCAKIIQMYIALEWNILLFFSTPQYTTIIMSAAMFVCESYCVTTFSVLWCRGEGIGGGCTVWRLAAGFIDSFPFILTKI